MAKLITRWPVKSSAKGRGSRLGLARLAAKLLSKDEPRRISASVAKLPELLRKT
jgi:hypothetical protein